MTDLVERKKQLLEELKRIEEEEQKEKDKARFDHLVAILDAGPYIIPLLKHERTSCSDEFPDNGYTTSGRGGHVRCRKCAFMEAYQEWTDNRDWLLPIKSGSTIEDQIGFKDISLEVHIMTDSIR